MTRLLALDEAERKESAERTALIEENMGLVTLRVNEITASDGELHGLGDGPDLFGEGCIGLMKSIDKIEDASAPTEYFRKGIINHLTDFLRQNEDEVTFENRVQEREKGKRKQPRWGTNKIVPETTPDRDEDWIRTREGPKPVFGNNVGGYEIIREDDKSEIRKAMEYDYDAGFNAGLEKMIANLADGDWDVEILWLKHKGLTLDEITAKATHGWSRSKIKNRLQELHEKGKNLFKNS